ncbi:aromatic compound dioxygenase [Aspergillus steynii IBT 23096]|uniref:Aromatic compound dioxygenase n=1 Tax=Aspergillus steynii IBT 23096 TaxID=1392250 RepID=A0A2I2GDX7_9EURO|nr:aromatic compound dioxygenase [Aspergillus steynii IBT 23096]PLB51072.1 aromatic compound dioxygenase [Aspergillus steynii IBT 23096]
MVQITSLILAGMAIFGSAFAHPAHDVKAEAAERAAFNKRTPVEKRSLGHCDNTLKARGHTARSVKRRNKTVQHLRRSLGLSTVAKLKGRSFESALNESHHSDLEGMTQYYNPEYEYLFKSESTCALAEDTTEGPYCRTQRGVPLWLDIQIIDSTTCEPEPQVYIDIWYCNATGIYSGVEASTNGKDFLTHNANKTIALANGTISGLYSSHSLYIGQLFFDQDLITDELTINAEDDILEGEAKDIDPFMEYVLLGDSVSDGISSYNYNNRSLI